MNNHDKVRNAISMLDEATAELSKAEEILTKALEKKSAALVQVDKARGELARQLRNVMPGRPVVFDGMQYKAGSNGLEISKWEGVIL